MANMYTASIQPEGLVLCIFSQNSASIRRFQAVFAGLVALKGFKSDAGWVDNCAVMPANEHTSATCDAFREFSGSDCGHLPMRAAIERHYSPATKSEVVAQ